MMKKLFRSVFACSFLLPLVASAGDEAPQAQRAAAAQPAPAKVECPALTKIKYPFLGCATDEWGQVVLAGPVQVLETSQMPAMDPYIDDPTYWGN